MKTINITDEMDARLHELCGDAWLCEGHQQMVVDTLLSMAIPLQQEKQDGLLSRAMKEGKYTPTKICQHDETGRILKLPADAPTPIRYHDIPRSSCEHTWDQVTNPQHCTKCGIGFEMHVFMEMP